MIKHCGRIICKCREELYEFKNEFLKYSGNILK